MLRVTLRYPYKVRKEDEYFDDIPEPKITKDMLDLATHIVETKMSEFDPKKFQDQYEDAVKELLKKKQAGEKIEVPKERKSILWKPCGGALTLRVVPRANQLSAQCSTGRGEEDDEQAAHSLAASELTSDQSLVQSSLCVPGIKHPASCPNTT